MNVAIVGSREFPDKSLVESYVSLLAATSTDKYVVVSGGARGVDTWAEEIAENNGLETKIFEADWDEHGNAAGIIRNEKIVDVADMVFAFWDGESKGTQNTIERCMEEKKPITIIVRHK